MCNLTAGPQLFYCKKMLTFVQSNAQNVLKFRLWMLCICMYVLYHNKVKCKTKLKYLFVLVFSTEHHHAKYLEIWILIGWSPCNWAVRWTFKFTQITQIFHNYHWCTVSTFSHLSWVLHSCIWHFLILPQDGAIMPHISRRLTQWSL